MTRWLKALGKTGGLIPETRLTQIGWVTHDIGFPRDPSVSGGDRLVLYATGFAKIFGVVEVHLPAQLDNREAPWSYRVETRPRLVLDDLRRAPDLDVASVGRDLRRSMRRQSHIRLSEAEYEAAVVALEAVCDTTRGDLRQPSISGRI